MKFNRIRVEHFKCYADADLTLDRGVTVIHGLNGSGKSSLLEACFFALYGSKALDETLDDVVSIGAEEATVELWFTHAGVDYHVERRVRVRDERAVTAKTVLDTPTETFEGANDVRQRITELVRMDHEAFVNCAYVRQGEVNKLINASPTDRQDVLDDLLQLGKLEEYRERASDARVGVGRVRDDKQGALSQLDEQITSKEDDDLHQRLNALESESNEVSTRIEHVEDQREKASKSRDDARSVLDEYEAKREELETIEEAIADLRDDVAETERERTELSEQIRARRETRDERREELDDALAESDLDEADPTVVGARIEALEGEDDDLRERIEEQRVAAQKHASTAESHGERADDLEERSENKRAEADELTGEIDADRKRIAERLERLDEVVDAIGDLEERFEGAPVDPETASGHRDEVAGNLNDSRRRVTELETTLESEREALAEAERLRDRGKCPECGQDVDGSPHVETIAEDRERVADLEADLDDASAERDGLEADLERAESLVEAATELTRLRDKRESVAQLVDEKEADLEEDEATVERLREEAKELKSDVVEERERMSTAEDEAAACRSVVAECNQKRQEVRGRIERLERVSGLLDRLEAAETDLERLRERHEQKGEVNDERRERLGDKRERRETLAEGFDDEKVERARTERDRASQYVEKADSELADLRERQSNVQNQVGAVKNEIEELETLRDRRNYLVEVYEDLQSLYEEADDLQRMYGTLRAELRQRNVETLERMVNETFDLVYQNDSYARIELDGEYRLTVYQKDGEPLDPAQLSGGERALFNLSLRCAIYRLLAEGIDGAAPMPPLILDEPTVFLDSGHVTQLLDVVEYMRDDVGVEQIVVVSHDDELVGAADSLIRVEKDATSNRSSVERVQSALVTEFAD